MLGAAGGRAGGGGEEPESSTFKKQPLGSSEPRDMLHIHICGQGDESAPLTPISRLTLVHRDYSNHWSFGVIKNI